MSSIRSIDEVSEDYGEKRHGSQQAGHAVEKAEESREKDDEESCTYGRDSSGVQIGECDPGQRQEQGKFPESTGWNEFRKEV
mgnify:CR=1 FL=1